MRGALFRFADVGVVAGGRDLLRDLTVDVRSGGVTGITGAVGGRQDHDAPAVHPLETRAWAGCSTARSGSNSGPRPRCYGGVCLGNIF